MLLLYAIPIGILLGLLGGGRVAPLAEVRIRFWPLALGGLLFQIVLFSSPLAAVVGDWGPPLYVGSTLVVLVALLFNLDQPGFRLIGLGAALNLAAIVANGGQMPATAEAWLALTGVAAVPTTDFSNSIIVSADAPLLFLGDVFVLPPPFPFANVFSIGDLLIGAGGVAFIAGTMRRTVNAMPRRQATRPTPSTPTAADAFATTARTSGAVHG